MPSSSAEMEDEEEGREEGWYSAGRSRGMIFRRLDANWVRGKTTTCQLPTSHTPATSPRLHGSLLYVFVCTGVRVPAREEECINETLTESISYTKKRGLR